jgi:hypothetical protein
MLVFGTRISASMVRLNMRVGISLRQALSVFNTDIDELVVASKGQSVFGAADRAWTGMVLFLRVWV